MVSCTSIMCKYDLNSASDVKKWLLKNHPDKGGKIDPDEFNRVIECYQHEHSDGSKGIFCNKTPSGTTGNARKTTTSNRAKNTIKKMYRKRAFNCMRKTANFSKINLYHKFDKSNFSPVDFNKNLLETSPKILRLLNNIKKLDELDIKNHGQVFKHFIFSDVKDGGYGAKILASALMSNGFTNVVKARKIPRQQRLRLYLDTSSNSRNKFALLCSNTIYGTTFNERVKREILSQFNKRPENIHGKRFRFVILDSGFKEGIDLFDVKYVHIFEPSMTIADLKQTIGRATRTCGQKGLEFIPNLGWPLYVYNYYLTVPDVTRESVFLPKEAIKNVKENNPDLDQESDYFLFRDVKKFNDGTMTFSEFDKAMVNLSQQLFYLAPQLAVDYTLTSNLHNIEDLNSSLFKNDVLFMRGGAGKRDVLKRVNRAAKYYSIDLINCKGKCGKKTTRDVPVSLDFMKGVYKKYKHSNSDIPKTRTNLREFFCQFMRENPEYCEQLNREWAERYSRIPEIIETNRGQLQIAQRLEGLEMEMGDGDDQDGAEVERDYKLLEYAGKQEQSGRRGNTNVPRSRLNFMGMRDFIKNNYNTREYKWRPITIENRCVDKSKPAGNDGVNKDAKANMIEFNPTQQFIINYFVPESPYKGILAWHSVGTGKTCTGVATASSSFERQGYNILWITRTTLKSDVWKNIFDQICHTVLSYEVENGLVLPEKLVERKRLLSNNWLEPMSYKQFSNLLSGKNKIYEVLRGRNGTEDILRKTLLIIDEAHKLYGGDLKPSERPDVEVMERLIMNSYRKSGQDSCRLLLMTATPITNSPMELFHLTNLFEDKEDNRIPTDPKKFKEAYMTGENILSERGLAKIANSLAGSISYLNRERDPTQFAQPIMIDVPAIMSHVEDTPEDIREYVLTDKKIQKAGDDSKELIKAMKARIKEFKSEYRKLRAAEKSTKKSGKAYCKAEHPGRKEKPARDECLKKLEADIKSIEREIAKVFADLNQMQVELGKLEENKEAVKDNSKQMRETIKKIKRSLLQEYMLFKRCGHLGYHKPETRRKTKRLK